MDFNSLNNQYQSLSQNQIQDTKDFLKSKIDETTNEALNKLNETAENITGINNLTQSSLMTLYGLKKGKELYDKYKPSDNESDNLVNKMKQLGNNKLDELNINANNIEKNNHTINFNENYETTNPNFFDEELEQSRQNILDNLRNQNQGKFNVKSQYDPDEFDNMRKQIEEKPYDSESVLRGQMSSRDTDDLREASIRSKQRLQELVDEPEKQLSKLSETEGTFDEVVSGLQEVPILSEIGDLGALGFGLYSLIKGGIDSSKQKREREQYEKSMSRGNEINITSPIEVSPETTKTQELQQGSSVSF